MKREDFPLIRQGPEIGIVQFGVPCGLFQKRIEPGFMLADGTSFWKVNGTVLAVTGAALEWTGCTFRQGSYMSRYAIRRGGLWRSRR